MNKVQLIGRVTKDIELRYTTSQIGVIKFTLAVDRRKKDSGTDFISCTAFGKTAEIMAEHVKKGHRVGIGGRIQTGSYEKNGQTIYTTDVIVDELDFLQPRDGSQATPQASNEPQDIYTDDLPF